MFRIWGAKWNLEKGVESFEQGSGFQVGFWVSSLGFRF